MSCSDEETDEETVVERSVELPASPGEVWAELPALLADDEEERITIVEESVPGERLSLWWMPVEGEAPPSYVELELGATDVGTLLRVRETRLDGATLIRSAFSARAFA